MEFQKQDGDECQLAVIAMLSNKPLPELRQLVLTTFGKSWLEMAKNHNISEASGKLCQILGLPRLTHHVVDNTLLMPDHSKTKYYGKKEEPDLSGRGQISISAGLRSNGHAMACGSGLVYDGNADGPLSWQNWKKTMSKNYVYKIVEVVRV